MIYSNEFCCRPEQYIHLDRSISSDRSGSRNVISERILGDWVFFTDSDHKFEPDLLARMLSIFNQFRPDGNRIDVLTGVYRYRVPPHLPVLYHYDADTDRHFHVAELDWSQPVMEIPCAGAGCLLIRRSVFQRIRDELKEKPFDEKPPLSEDFSFFQRLRQLGIKSYVAPQIKSDHLLVKPVTDEDYKREEVQAVPMPNGGMAAVGKIGR
jgi:GT2 family glycosyltransferase